jgi:hypothetical protein
MQNDHQIKDYLNKNFIKVNIDTTKEKENLIYQEFGEWHAFLIIPGVKFEQAVHLKFQESDSDQSPPRSDILVAIDTCLEKFLPFLKAAAGTGNQWARNYLSSKGIDW